MKYPLLLVISVCGAALRLCAAAGQVGHLLHPEAHAETTLLVSTARLPIKPESRPVFLATEAALAVPTRQEAGCLSYTVYEDPSALNTFFTVEEWATRAAWECFPWEAHGKHSDAAAYQQLLPGWLAGLATSQLYQVSRRQVVITPPATH
ncbi:putative quinol monooxygenase [Hymenobacter sp. UV11]|jgi:quinol monooxygenase YgiN|uniref:putative quinol monooxygenase n=1 Tax=Hymenobacter sp. UV11 TaxID=1849735 RepID=UPI0010DC9424|nr:putative quinol monooxygenase [Hymenobacter sp. UV11]TDN39663.1 hypothetical protein A8B98_17750 [Hymenobacter sp. UV11]